MGWRRGIRARALFTCALLLLGLAPLAAREHAGAAASVFRVDVGGSGTGTGGWAADTNAKPSPYRRGGVAGTRTGVVLGHRSLPLDTPAKLFTTIRRKDASAFAWSFPVTPGHVYQLRLYAAETARSTTGGTFRVVVEGTARTVDVLAAAGGRGIAVMIPFDLTARDGTLDVSFRTGTRAAFADALEVVDRSIAEPVSTTSPASTTTTSAPATTTTAVPLADDPGWWSSLPPVPGYAQAGSVAGVDGALHVFGGQDRVSEGVFTPKAAHLRYVFAEARWHAAAAVPTPASHVQAVVVDGLVYAIGGLIGWPGPAVGDVRIYDPGADTWTAGTPMPRPRGGGGVAAGPDGRIYYAGGLADGRVVPWVDVYDPRSGQWSSAPDMPVALDHLQAVVVDRGLHVVSGRARYADAIVGRHLRADLGGAGEAPGPWHDRTPMPVPSASYAASELDGRILVFGGEDRYPNTAYDAAVAYDPAADSWRRLTDMPHPRHDFGVATCAGAVYLVGGSTDGGELHPTDTVDVLSFGGPPRPCAAPPPLTTTTTTTEPPPDPTTTSTTEVPETTTTWIELPPEG